MAQLYIQKSAQPDTWVMSGAPTATTVFLSLDADINYSDGTSDTLPANTLAVLPDSTTVFDRTHDVFVCYTVQTSRVLSVIKESLLPTLTSAYAPLCRIELHGIKPYQPEPYLASGGLGGATTPTTTTVSSAAGAGRVLALWNGTSNDPAPSGWQDTGFDDSAWSSSTSVPGTPIAVITATQAESATTADHIAPGEIFLYRRAFTLPAGTVTSGGTLTIHMDDAADGIWLNGTFVVTLAPNDAEQTVALPLSALVPGASNVLAISVRNTSPAVAGSYYSVDYQTSFSSAVPSVGSASEGDLLYYHGGAWIHLPIGASGQELTVVSGDPAWATPAAGGTVTSVALSVPGFLSVAGSPISTSGTLSLSLANENPATVFAGPASGSAGAPTFRTLQGSDLPAAAGAAGHVHAHGHFL